MTKCVCGKINEIWAWILTCILNSFVIRRTQQAESDVEALRKEKDKLLKQLEHAKMSESSRQHNMLALCIVTYQDSTLS